MSQSWIFTLMLVMIFIGSATPDAAACRDSTECGPPGVCEDNSQELLTRLCPAKCGLCDCKDNPGFNCTGLLPGVCSSAVIASVCPKTCTDCVNNNFPFDVQCPNTSCGDCMYPLGRAACPDFCGKCSIQSTTMAPTSASTSQTTTPDLVKATSTTTPRPSGCNKEQFNGCDKAEVVFMIAHTKFDTYDGIDHEGVYVTEIIKEFKVDEGHVRVGVVSYNDTVQESIHITEYKNNLTGLLDRVKRLTENRQQANQSHELMQGGAPNVAGALDWVRRNAFKDARPGAKRVLIPIIHRLSLLDLNLALAAATGLKQSCVQIYAQSVDHSITLGDIVALIATHVYPPWYNYYASFRDLENGSKMFHLQCPQQ